MSRGRREDESRNPTFPSLKYLCIYNPFLRSGDWSANGDTGSGPLQFKTGVQK